MPMDVHWVRDGVLVLNDYNKGLVTAEVVYVPLGSESKVSGIHLGQKCIIVISAVAHSIDKPCEMACRILVYR